MSDRSECAMGFCYRKPDPGSLFCERHKETEALRARIAELTGALEAMIYGIDFGLRRYAEGGGGPMSTALEYARAALARPSMGGGALDAKKREPGCRCHREEGDSECPVHDAAPARAPGTGMEPGQAVPVEVDPVEAVMAVECPSDDCRAAVGLPCLPSASEADFDESDAVLVTDCDMFCADRIRRASRTTTKGAAK